MTPSNEGLRYAYEMFLGIEAPLDLDLGSLQKTVEDKFLRRPDYSDMSEEERSEMGKGITAVIISIAKDYDKDYESFFGGQV